MTKQEVCQAPGCSNPTDRGICDDCDDWVSREVAAFTEQSAMTLAAKIGPILKEAFPEAHSITRLQAAEAIADEIARAALTEQPK